MVKRGTRGFTLVEMIMSLVIIVILAGLAGPLLAVSVDAMGLHMDRADLDESASLALSRMGREIRRLRNDESVGTASATVFEFVDNDDVQIRYRLTSTTLMRTQGANPESGLADQVQAGTLAFTYYDDDGNTIATPTVGLGTSTNIRRVRIQMTFATGTHSLPVQIDIRPRNLRHESEMFF